MEKINFAINLKESNFFSVLPVCCASIEQKVETKRRTRSGFQSSILKTSLEKTNKDSKKYRAQFPQKEIFNCGGNFINNMEAF